MINLNLLFLTCFALIGSVGFVSWIGLLKRKKNGQQLLGRWGGRNLIGSPFGLLDVFVVFFAWFGGQAVAVGAAMLLMGVSAAELPELEGQRQASLLGIVGLAQLIGILLSMVVLYVRYCLVGRASAQAIGLQPQNIIRDIGLGSIAFTMVIPIVLVIQWLLTFLLDYDHPSLEMLDKDAAASTFVLVWFVAPVCEEIFFRGTLQAWLQRLGSGRMGLDQVLVGGWDNENLSLEPSDGESAGEQQVSEEQIQYDPNPYRAPQDPDPENGLGSRESTENMALQKRSWTTQSHWPIYVTSAIFAGLHIGQGAAPIPLFLLAVVLGYLYRKTESILPCIVLHMLLNTFSLFWYTINVFFGSDPVLPS